MSPKTAEVVKALNDGFKHIENRRFWKHYKGGTYKILNVVFDTHTGGPAYVYKRIGGPDFDAENESHIDYVRTVEEWFSNVDGTAIARFTPL